MMLIKALEGTPLAKHRESFIKSLLSLVKLSLTREGGLIPK